MEKKAGWMFRYRGQIPILFFLLILPFVFCYNLTLIDDKEQFLILSIISWAMIGLGIAFRIYITGYRLPHSSGRNRNNHVAESLNQLGAYSLCQHPIYFANIILWVGISLYSNHLILIILSLPISLFIHLNLMSWEQQFLQQKFGETYLQWARKTAVLWPSIRTFQPNQVQFDTKRVFATEYPTWVSIIVVSWCMYRLKIYQNAGLAFWDKNDIQFIGFALIVGFGGRFYKYIILKKKV